MKKSLEIDKRFDEGESVLNMVKKNGKIEVKQNTMKINVNFPVWMIEALDEESTKLAIDRQAVIKVLLNESLCSKGYKAP